MNEKTMIDNDPQRNVVKILNSFYIKVHFLYTSFLQRGTCTSSQHCFCSLTGVCLANNPTLGIFLTGWSVLDIHKLYLRPQWHRLRDQCQLPGVRIPQLVASCRWQSLWNNLLKPHSRRPKDRLMASLATLWPFDLSPNTHKQLTKW